MAAPLLFLLHFDYKDIVLNVPDEIIFEPSYNDIKSKFDDSGLYEKIKSLQDLYEENYEESEKENLVLFLFLGLFDRSIQLFEFIFKYF